MIKITKEFNGNIMMIDLNEEDVRYIISECAVIGLRTDAQPAAKEPKQYTMPKTIRTGCFKDHKDEVLQMLDQGMSRHKIAAYFGVSDHTAAMWIERWTAGVDARHNNYHAELTLRDGFEMMQRHASGMSYVKIAAEYGINYHTVKRWINKARQTLNVPAA